MKIKLKCEGMNELEMGLVTNVSSKIVPEVIERYKERKIEFGYFKLLGFSKKVYQKWGYDLNINLCNDLKKQGITKTSLSFEEIEIALKKGESKADLILSLVSEGREYIDRAMGKTRVLN